MTTGADLLFDMSGKVVAITGGGRGLGRQMAEAFARRGARVAIASRKREVCEAAAAEISAATGSDLVGLGLHVGRWEQCETFVEEVADRLGRCTWPRRPPATPPAPSSRSTAAWPGRRPDRSDRCQTPYSAGCERLRR